jgi:hypothetical protein
MKRPLPSAIGNQKFNAPYHFVMPKGEKLDLSSRRPEWRRIGERIGRPRVKTIFSM